MFSFLYLPIVYYIIKLFKPVQTLTAVFVLYLLFSNKLQSKVHFDTKKKTISTLVKKEIKTNIYKSFKKNSFLSISRFFFPSVQQKIILNIKNVIVFNAEIKINNSEKA